MRIRSAIKTKLFCVAALIACVAPSALGQRAEVTISLNEQFFDALLESVFHNFEPPEFSLASTEPIFEDGTFLGKLFRGPSAQASSTCDESVKILREMRGVKTSVRFRDGKVQVPLAFSGRYAPPLLGCFEFAGWADSNIDLTYDPDNRKLVGRARVTNVNLNGTGGVGGTVVARLIQGTIDRKLNPIDILDLDRVSFVVPVRDSGNLRLKALSMKPEAAAGALNVRVLYEFSKG